MHSQERSLPRKALSPQEILTEQITSYLQKVSLSSQDTEKVLAALDREQDKARESAQSEVIVLKEQLSQVEAKLQKLLDIYLADALSTEEYAAKKQSLLSQKVSLSEKITDFETKGLSWLEPAREFVKSLNQAANLLSSPNPIAMTTFLKNIGSNHILRNREFVFTPKIEYELVAERSEANQNSLTFPVWCTLQDSNLRPTRCKRVALPTELSVQDIFLYPVPTCTSFKEFFPPHRITSLIIRLTVNQCPWTMF